MYKLLLLLCCLPSFAGHFLIRAGKVLVPESGELLSNQLLLIEDGTIRALGPDLEQPDGVSVIDLSDATVLPGLMDCHTHLCWHINDRKNDGYVLSIVREPTPYRAIQGVANARDMLAAGFTTVRDVGNAANYADSALRMAIEDGLVPGPTIINAGRIISPFGGQRWVIPERPDYTQPEYYFADTRDELKKAIRQNIHFGARLIKLVVDDQKYMYSEADIRFVVEEARLAGFRVAAHCATERGAVNAIRAGVASIEHGFSMTAETMALAREHGVPLVSTTFSLPVLQAMASDLSNPPEKDYRSGVATLKLAYEHGVTVAFGSDIINKVPGLDRGEATMTYLRSFQDAGATPLQIIQAMTVNAARTIGIEKERGFLKPGLAADIIATRTNPLDDIDALKRLIFVMKDGRVIRHER